MIESDSVFLQKAMKAYQNIQCVSLDEFNEDLNRITNIKKAVTRYMNGDEINTRLVLNQFIILFNVFGETAFDMIKYRFDAAQRKIVYAFLVAINRLPMGETIMLDQIIVEKLRGEING